MTALGSCQHLVTPYFSIRSQGVNTARHVSGQWQFMQPGGPCAPYGFFSTTLEYARSFKPAHITRCLFGIEENQTITIAGSTVTDRNAQTDWLADYFYLPTDFKSTISFNPCIDNITIDFNGFLGLDRWNPGLYVAVYAPLVHTRWRLHMHECVINKGVADHPAGYFTPQTLSRGMLLNTFSDYAQGMAPLPVTQLRNASNPLSEQLTTFFGSLNRACISPTKRTKTRFADLRAIIGYTALSTDCYAVGGYLMIAAPAGNRPEAQYLFEPMVGTGHHAELGVGIKGQYTFINNDCYAVSAYFDANMVHLFGTRQDRAFDLVGKPFSRYMLAAKFGTPDNRQLRGAANIDGTSQPIGGTTTATQQFARSFTPVANLSTLTVNVSVGVQAEFVALMNVRYQDYRLDIGYNLWARSCEKISVRKNPLDNNTAWALKGDAQVFGFAAITDGGIPSLVQAGDAVGLSGTQSGATISSGLNSQDTALVANTGVDNAQFAFAGTNNVNLLRAPAPATTLIQTSIQPILLKSRDINVCQHATRALTSSLFSSITYSGCYDPCHCWQPYFAVGGRVEWAHGSGTSCNKNACTQACITCGVSQWILWFKAGITFE